MTTLDTTYYLFNRHFFFLYVYEQQWIEIRIVLKGPYRRGVDIGNRIQNLLDWSWTPYPPQLSVHYYTITWLKCEHATLSAIPKELALHPGGEAGVPASAWHRSHLGLQQESCHPKWRKRPQRHPHSDHQISGARLSYLMNWNELVSILANHSPVSSVWDKREWRQYCLVIGRPTQLAADSAN